VYNADCTPCLSALLLSCLPCACAAPFKLIRALSPLFRDAAKAEQEASGAASPRSIINISSTSGTHGNSGQVGAQAVIMHAGHEGVGGRLHMTCVPPSVLQQHLWHARQFRACGCIHKAPAHCWYLATIFLWEPGSARVGSLWWLSVFHPGDQMSSVLAFVHAIYCAGKATMFGHQGGGP
jgi:NAD(P)-dependent dehydrogenase (short-subunit alcohol dehydrogenase family)